MNGTLGSPAFRDLGNEEETSRAAAGDQGPWRPGS